MGEHFDNPQFWSADQAYRHLKRTFELACKENFEIMEPYLPLIVAATERDEEISIMRQALSPTVKQRYPYTMGPTR